jgi:outer membrane protein
MAQPLPRRALFLRFCMFTQRPKLSLRRHPGVFLRLRVKSNALSVVAMACALLHPTFAGAASLSDALSLAYSNNPDLNQQRAALRARDEAIPKAKAGYLPKVSGQSQGGYQHSMVGGYPNTITNSTTTTYTTTPFSYGVTLNQTLFDGMRTASSVDQAESNVFMQRENLRRTETGVLLAAATAYMDVMRDSAVVRLRRNNMSVLASQLSITQLRQQYGELTMTDVAQAQAALANANAEYGVSISTLTRSVAAYRKTVGQEPKDLQPVQSVERLLPGAFEQLLKIGLREHPSILAANYQVDAAEAEVKIAESALLPQLSMQAQALKSTNSGGFTNYNSTSYSVLGTLSVPIYQGGSEYASIRMAKEQLGQARLAFDSQRELVREAIATALGQLKAARNAVAAYRISVTAAESALNGVREEALVGQRTTQDVLNAQQTLLSARVQLIGAQHDVIVASYSALAAIGRLNAERVNLDAPAYQPSLHYQQTKDRLFGVSVSDGQ